MHSPQEWVTMTQRNHVEQKHIAVANLYFFLIGQFRYASPPDQNWGPAWKLPKADVTSSLNIKIHVTAGLAVFGRIYAVKSGKRGARGMMVR